MNLDIFRIENTIACLSIDPGTTIPASVKTAVSGASDMDDLIAKLAYVIGENADGTAQAFIQNQISHFETEYAFTDSDNHVAVMH